MYSAIYIVTLILLGCALGVSVEINPIDSCKQTGPDIYCNRIPAQIPNNVTHVHLQKFLNVEEITGDSLNGSNWENVKFLQIFCGADESLQRIKPYAMIQLKSLEELKIVCRPFKRLYKNSFAGLNNLKVLNFTGCEHLHVSAITVAITGVNMLPKLEVLSMTFISIHSYVNLDKDFFNALAPKPIKLLDLHHIEVNKIDPQYFSGILDTLQYLNVSRTTFLQDAFKNIDISQRFDNVTLLDASYTTLPINFLSVITRLPGVRGISFPLSAYDLTVISNIETLDVSGIYDQNFPAEFYNYTIYLEKTNYSDWQLKNMILKNNKLKHLDLTVPCHKSNLELLDLSLNEMEFFQPKLCKCCYNLQEINFSDNNLFKMANRNSTLFGHLIAFYPNLKKLKLSSNRLTMIPKQMFNTNKNLEEIELSSNLLTQVTFRLEHLVNLKILSLQNNRISILNYDSRLILNSLLMTINTDRNISATLQIANNPISCSECDTLASIEWLSTTSLSYGDIHCKNPEGNLISIDHIATNFVQEECDRAVRIRNAIVLSVFIPISTIISMVLIMCKWRTNRQKQFYRKKMEKKIRKIQMNELDTKYLIFLAFSSYDYNFLNINVFGPLKHHLQLKTGTDRDLICFGDKNFQLGKPVHDEMALCLQQSAVVMLLLSRSFCNSEFCRMEFDMALFMKKPFILMIKDELDESEMVPSLQELFKRNTRLLWERHDNHFYLRTSWDNVVNSVLELVP